MNFILFFLFISFRILIIFISVFLYNGATIYEQIVNSGFNDIYTKINNDTINIIKQNNKDLKYIFAVDNDHVYSSSALLKVNSLNKEIYLIENRNEPIVEIFKTDNMLKTIFLNLNKKFNYKILE